jgi:hypothetical protein
MEDLLYCERENTHRSHGRILESIKPEGSRDDPFLDINHDMFHHVAIQMHLSCGKNWNLCVAGLKPWQA